MTKMKLEDFYTLASESMKEGYITASLTDEYILDTWPMQKCTLEGKVHKILEIRIFNPEQELKLFRTDVFQEDFRYREISISDESRMTAEKDYFDQDQYLDIDTKTSKESFAADGTVFATGGGKYHLPLQSMEHARVTIRYYFAQSPSGTARIRDWRLVNLIDHKGKGGVKNG